MGSAPLGAWGEERPRVAAVRATASILVDGRLDESDWARAGLIDRLRVDQPIAGAPLELATEIRVLFDEHSVYFAIRAHDDDVAAIRANAMRRDQSQRPDDAILIILDTFNDRRSGYVFSINSNGARMDALIEDNGAVNLEWDGIWFGRARLDASGWTAEVAIPTKTLNFDRDISSWGLQIGRTLPRHNHTGRWAFPDPAVFFFDVGHTGELTGLGPFEQGLGLDLVPQGVVRQTRDNPGRRRSHKFEPVFDAFYKVTPSLTGVLTANTDFSDATPDDRQANLTRFSLFFPEQRDFFLQDAGIFRFGDFGARRIEDPERRNGRPFFSRRIGLDSDGPLDIRVGGKLTGRIGRLNLGLLTTRVEGHDDVDGQWLSVGRLSMRVLEESTLGVIGTYGDPTGTLHNKVFGADFNYRNTHLFETRILQGHLWALRSSSTGTSDREGAFGGRLRYPNDRWNWELAAAEIQENFNPALGFANRTDIRDYEVRVRRRLRPASGSVRTWDWFARARLVTGTDDDLQSLELELDAFKLETHSGDVLRLGGAVQREDLMRDFEIRPGILIRRDSYRFNRAVLEIDTSRNRPLELDVEIRWGEFFGGTRFDWESELTWRMGRHGLIRFDYEQFQVRLPQGRFTTRIARLGVDFAFSPRLAWTNLIQWDNETDDLSWNSRVRWILQPGRELILVLDPRFRRDDRFRLEATRTELVVKLLWTVRL